MRPATGVAIELGVLAVYLLSSLAIPAGLVFGIYTVVGELLGTYLIHVPAHYIVGSVLGIRFTKIRVGRTTLAKALPKSLSRPAGLIPILTLTTDKTTLPNLSKRRISYMFASGTVASTASALIIAAAASIAEPPSYAALAWMVALAYLAFDIVFSPKSGDLMRARAALRA